ncbi:MAG: XdhC/CoxI family protein [Ignavibacteriae bacterium]|nr:MAG: XdhC/CoxI family protein [Ignavibacteriota bacterium]
MNDLQKILHRYDELRLTGEPCALATIVSIRGSAYRRPGARILFSSSGREAGFVSAACMEADLFGKVKNVLAGSKPALFSYDTTAPEDLIFGVGQGCGGVVEFLIEPVLKDKAESTVGFLEAAAGQREPCALATVYQSTGSEREAIGAKIFLSGNGIITTSLTQPDLAENITRDMQEALHLGQSTTKQYHSSASTADVFIEIILPPVPLLVFGATPEVRPLVRMAAELGWNITVVDHRSAYAVKKDFPEADSVLLLSPAQYGTHLRLTPETVAVIMIHQFAAEAAALRTLLSSPARYIGLLGPKSKRDLLFRQLAEEGFIPSKEQSDKFFNPVGLDIGAETSEEIAASIISEIQAFLKNRSGGYLRNRKGPIH